jgi:hypothetical protein
MPTGDNTRQLRLTSQYARGVRGADAAALDAQGRDWYLSSPDDVQDRDWPLWPKCVVCGRAIDPLTDPAWFSPGAPGNVDLWAHPDCAVLVYPDAAT